MRGTADVDEPTSTAGSSDSTLPVVQAATKAASKTSALADKARGNRLLARFGARLEACRQARPSFAIGAGSELDTQESTTGPKPAELSGPALEKAELSAEE